MRKTKNEEFSQEVPRFLLFFVCKGTGGLPVTNLQSGGSTLIWFGLTWSLELYQQTNARLWRQGQKSTVVIHHIISKDTIDEDVMKALRLKEKTQTDLIDAVKVRIGGGAYDG